MPLAIAEIVRLYERRGAAQYGSEAVSQLEHALPFLRGTFPPAVLEPIRLHVDAKRFLCRAMPGYWDTLSPASRHSLELQGGMFSQAEAKRFLERPFARDAVALRRWDDLAKAPGTRTPGIAHYARALSALAATV